MTAALKFGNRLRSVRKSKNLKIWQIAEKVNVEVKHLGRIERGEKKPSFDLIIALAEHLGVSPSQFFDFDAIDTDPKPLRKQINRVLAHSDGKSLRRARKILEILFEP